MSRHDGETFNGNYCLHGYTTKELLDSHIADCRPHGALKVTFLKKEEQQWIHFISINKQLVPFLIDNYLIIIVTKFSKRKTKVLKGSQLMLICPIPIGPF